MMLYTVLRIRYLILALLSLVASISGCASQYVPPESGPIAQVTYKISQNIDTLQLYAFENEECEGVKQIFLFRKGKKQKEVTIRVQAGKRLINTFRIAGWYKIFYTSTNFMPKENEKYLVEIDLVENFASSRVLRYSNEGMLKPDMSAKEQVRVCFF